VVNLSTQTPNNYCVGQKILGNMPFGQGLYTPRLHQEESRSISENVTWGQRKRFADGKVSMPYGQFLGYEKGEDGIPKIVEKEAVVVSLIYKLFLEGKTPSGIAKHLTTNKILTPGGKEVWQQSTVISILKNEKYKGDAMLQKSFTVDFLTKKKKINEGEIPQYYVENSHPAIITPEVFELVQEEFRRRKLAGKHTSAINCFASKIVCGDCGGFYGRKVWHSTSKYATTIWQCNNKFHKRKSCSTPHLKEEIIKKAFVNAFNTLIESKEELIAGYEEVIEKITNFSKQEKEGNKIDEECILLEKSLEKLIAENTRTSMDQDEYNTKYSGLATRYNSLQNRRQEISTNIAKLKGRKNQMNAFTRDLVNQENLLISFDESLWCSTLNAVIIKSNVNVIFQFKDGTELPWDLE
jgi:site-specific DNA recombinase